jgi:hypothetical protein
MHIGKCIFILVVAVLVGARSSVAYAQQASERQTPPARRTILVHVIDIYREPVEGIVLSNQGEGSQSDPTDNSGRTYIGLPGGTKPNDQVSLQLVRGLKGNEEWELIGVDRVVVPPLEDKPDSFVTIVLMKKIDKQLLVNRSYLNILNRNEKQPSKSNNLEKEYEPEMLWRGINILREQEREIEHQKTKMVDVILSLAQLLYSEGKYQEAIDRCREGLLLYPYHLNSHIQLALALTKVGNYTEAELVYEQLLRIHETQEMSQSELINVLENYLIVLRRLNRELKAAEIKRRIEIIHANPFQ